MPTPPLVTVTVDGVEMRLPKGKNLLQALLDAGVYVPHYCYHPALSIAGNCRLCLVEVKGSNKLLPACTTQATEGMDVTTDSDRLRRYRRQILELLFAERNHVCAICVANGTCELQAVALEGPV